MSTFVGFYVSKCSSRWLLSELCISSKKWLASYIVKSKVLIALSYKVLCCLNLGIVEIVKHASDIVIGCHILSFQNYQW